MEDYITRLEIVKQAVAMFQGKSWSLDETLLANIRGVQELILQLQDISVPFRAIIDGMVITDDGRDYMEGILGKIGEILGIKNEYCNAVLHQLQCIQNVITSLSNLSGKMFVVNHVEFSSFPISSIDSSGTNLVVLNEAKLHEFLLNLKDLFIQETSNPRDAIVPELEEILGKLASCCAYLDPYLAVGDSLFKTLPPILSRIETLGNDLSAYFQPVNALIDAKSFQSAFDSARAALDTLVASEEFRKTNRVKLKSVTGLKKESIVLEHFAKILVFDNNLPAESSMQEKNKSKIPTIK